MVLTFPTCRIIHAHTLVQLVAVPADIKRGNPSLEWRRQPATARREMLQNDNPLNPASKVSAHHAGQKEAKKKSLLH